MSDLAQLIAEKAASIADEVARSYAKLGAKDRNNLFYAGAECAAEQIAEHIRQECSTPTPTDAA